MHAKTDRIYKQQTGNKGITKVMNMEKLDDFYLIENYVEGKLTGSELNDFEKKIEKYPELKQYLADYQYLVKEIQDYSRQETKKTLENIHREVIEKKQTQSWKKNSFIKIAAVFGTLIILASPFFYQQFSNGNKNDTIFRENFEAYSSFSTERGTATTHYDALEKSAQYYYQKNNFEEAVLLYEEYFKENPEVPKISRFYYAVSCLGAGHTEKAIENMDMLLLDPKFVLYEQTLWYAALAELKNGNNKKAIAHLETIIQIDGVFALRSKSLKSQIK
jgi:tetratricopeptide (TPR) repeat protein